MPETGQVSFNSLGRTFKILHGDRSQGTVTKERHDVGRGLGLIKGIKVVGETFEQKVLDIAQKD